MTVKSSKCSKFPQKQGSENRTKVTNSSSGPKKAHFEPLFASVYVMSRLQNWEN